MKPRDLLKKTLRSSTAHNRAKIITVAGIESNVGCTHFAIMLAHYLIKERFKVAILECNRKEDFFCIEKAYEAAYPNLSSEISFTDKVKELSNDQEITGFISGIKGKLFELEYVDYLNSSHLPNGYIASIADNANQQGWDIAIKGPNGEVAELLQAKATDSIYYVQQALEKYPTIDVVTTDEVYSHLVMSSVSENITNSGISLSTMTEQVELAVDGVNLSIDFTPPAIALAFIAFTSYKNDSLTLYEKAKHAGSRSGKTYLSYLIGSGIAVITNTWWLGILGSVTSRYISDSGLCKYELTNQLKKTKSSNQKIINQLSLYK